MRKWIVFLAAVTIPAVLTTLVAGRFTPLSLIAWAVFYAALFGPYAVRQRRQLACRWPQVFGR